MIADIQAVMWKEWRELFERRGSTLRNGPWNVIIALGVFGIFLPLQFSEMWLTSLFTVFWIVFISSFWTVGYIADTFAGERERHTLETLLASRLSDAAIVLGKLGAVVLYVWAQVIVSLLIGAITVNLVRWDGHIQFYRASVIIAAVGLGLLGAGLLAALGILLSLHAPTARQAQQRLLIPVTLVLMLPSLGSLILPADLREQLFRAFAEVDIITIVLALLAGLLVADAALIALAVARFQRSRLSLD
jgi:ABC-2 type transport system permease protein